MQATRVIGMDVGGTKILAGLVERDGRVARRTERPTPVRSQDTLLAGLADAVEELLEDGVAAIGFGIPSTIDRRTGTAVFSTNIPLAGLDLGGWMHGRFGLPAAVENDANAAAIAEWTAGAGRGTTDMVLLTLGTGVGGGLILGGRPFRGWIGAGAELGHMVISIDGPPCQGACTGHGHLESLASGSAATELARAAFGPGADAHLLVRLAAEGDVRARELVAELGRRLGAGIATLVNVFNPELVVIGGGFAAAGEPLLDAARAVVACDGLPPARDVVRIVPAELGTDAGMIGAGLVAFEELEAAG